MKQLYCALIFACFLVSSQAVSQQLPPAIEWQKALGGSNDDRAMCIIRTADGGFLVAGMSKSNDGDVSGHHGPSTTYDAWVAKLSFAGDIEWQRSLGGSGNDEFRTVMIGNDGSYICMGKTGSNDGDVSGAHGNDDIWIVKLSRQGDLIWQKCYGGSSRETPGAIRVINNKYYFIGSTESGNGDVTGFFGFRDIWVFQFDESGNIVKSKCFGGTSYDAGFDINGVSNGKLLMIVDLQSSMNNLGGLTLNPPTNSIVLLDSSWVYERKNSVQRNEPSHMIKWGASTFFYATNVWNCYPANPTTAIAAFSAVYNANSNPPLQGGSMITSFGPCTPSFGTTFPYSFEASSGLSTVNGIDLLMAAQARDTVTGTHGGTDGFLASVRTSGNVVSWKKYFGGTGTDAFTGIVQLNETETMVAGYTSSNNGDVSGNHGSTDVWIVKLGKVNIIGGTVFLDYNLNGIKDAAEPNVNNYLVESQKPSVKFGSLTVNGVFRNHVDTGTYVTKVVTTNNYYTPVPASVTSSFTTYNNVQNISFAMQPIPGLRNYKVNLFGITGNLRPGFNTQYYLVYTNIGTDTLQNKSVKLVKDPRTTFISASVTPTSIVGDTITWNISSLNPRASGNILLELKIAAPPVVNISDQLVTKASIDTTGDLEPANNTAVVTQVITGAFDPNDKNESFGGKVEAPVVSSKDLTYTIRFQNTGNDTAFTVVVRDTLSSKLDWSTIQMLASSHNYQLSIKNGNELTWTFDKILLVDSVHNEPLSHGFITYSIRANAGVAVGDTIRNSASIYFDFNLPVKTNVHETVVVPSLLVAPNVSGVRGSYCSNEGLQSGKINNLPAPGSGVTTSVKLDGNALSIAADSTFSFNVSTLAAGAHVIEVTYSNGSETKTTTINFNITAAVTPDVNVSSNITTAVNLLDPVIITAANAAGGGSSPLYTFGKDRNFTTLWQAEGSNNVLNINPTALQNGDNWIYVRMKTSSTCFTVQSNIDSIKITLQLPVPNQPVITGINANYCVNEGLQKAKITNYPAPGTGSTITAKIDGNAVAIALADTSFSFNVTTLGAGSHVAEVTYTNLSGTKTTTVNFTVTALVTPDVNVTANIRNVSSLTDPIVITASNATGGGQTPAYSFARNRTFTDIIQAEGTAATVSITPTALKLGENWIYVRMKTSSNCYTQQTAVDSISITRFGSRGLIDPDYPDQVITSNPNPFRNQINVYGLSANKNYTTILYNQQGKAVGKARVTGRTIAMMRTPGHAAGSYMLSIYDETKNRLIGTLSVLKQ